MKSKNGFVHCEFDHSSIVSIADENNINHVDETAKA